MNSYDLKLFHKQGFVILKNSVSESWQERLKARAHEIVENWDFDSEPRSIFYGTLLQKSLEGQAYIFESLEKVSCFFARGDEALSYDGKNHKIIEIGHALHCNDPLFHSFAKSRIIVDIVQCLGYSKAMMFQSRYFMKPPGSRGVPPHQDGSVFYTTSPSCITLWIALEDATIENGCVWAIPGSHELGLQSRRIIDPTSGLGVFAPVEKDNEINYEGNYVPLEVPAGGIIVTHGGLVHRSYRNNSSSTRQALALHICEAGAIFPTDNWFPQPSAASSLML